MVGHREGCILCHVGDPRLLEGCNHAMYLCNGGEMTKPNTPRAQGDASQAAEMRLYKARRIYQRVRT